MRQKFRAKMREIGSHQGARSFSQTEVTSLVSKFAKERVRLEMGLYHASAAVFAEIFVAFRLGKCYVVGRYESDSEGRRKRRYQFLSSIDEGRQ